MQNEFICADCMKYLPEFPDNYFDIAIVDPPYGLNEHGGKKRGKWVRQKNGVRTYVTDGKYTKKDWDVCTPDKEYFSQLFRISQNQIIFGVNYFDYPMTGGRIIWDKCNDGSDQSDAEIAYNSLNNRVDIFRYMWRGMFQGKSIDQGWIQQGNKQLNEKRIHPTQKPVNLYRWICREYLQPDWKILDTHVGSASSLLAYEEFGANYIGFERDTEYYETASKRLADSRMQISIFDFIREKAMRNV